MIRVAFPGYGPEPAETLYFEAIAAMVDAKMQLWLIERDGSRRVIAVRDQHLSNYWAVDPGVLRGAPLVHGADGEPVVVHHGLKLLTGRSVWTFCGVDDRSSLFVLPFDGDLIDYVACLDRRGLWIEREDGEGVLEILIARPDFLLADLYSSAARPRSRPSALSAS